MSLFFITNTVQLSAHLHYNQLTGRRKTMAWSAAADISFIFIASKDKNMMAKYKL